MTQQSQYQKSVDALGRILSAFEEVEETQRPLLLRTVSEFLQASGALPQAATMISPAPSTPQMGQLTNATAGQPTSPSPASTPQAACTPKQFIDEKQPASDMERVACLAFYLTHVRQQNEFNSSDIADLNTEAAQDKFTKASATVANTMRSARYLASAGNGKQQISALGERVVKALPDREAVKAVLAKHKRRPRRGAKKKATKKKE